MQNTVKKKILFHVVSTYQLIYLIIYKIKYYNDENTVLLVADTLLKKYPNIKDLLWVFDDIIVYNLAYPKSVLDKSFNEDIKNHFEGIFKEHKHDINKFDEIIVGCAHYYFGIFLVTQNIKFTFMEDAAGILSRPFVLDNIEKPIFPDKNKIVLSYGLYNGNSECVTKKICNMSAQVEGFSDDKAEHFDVVEELLELSNESQKKIVNFFIDIDKLEIPKDSILILTQHFANLRILSFEDHALIYQMMVDYFFTNDNIVFKPHPDDIMYYSELFPQAGIVREKFPSEFLPIIFNNKPKGIATISSTAINNLKNNFDNIFTMDFEYEKQFHFTHKYYVTLKLLKYLSSKSVNVVGSNKRLLENLWNHSDITGEKCVFSYNDINESNNFLIIDDLDENRLNEEEIIPFLNDLDNEKCVVFINSKHNFCFYDINHKNIWDYITPITITKKVLREDEFYDNEKTEVLYVYTKSEELKKMIENFECEKELKNIGMEISVSHLTPDQRRIKVLEGILEATEKRLLYYIEKDKEEKNK